MRLPGRYGRVVLLPAAGAASDWTSHVIPSLGEWRSSHGPDIGSREGTVSGEKLRQRQISLPIFFVKKDALQVKSTKCLYTGRHAHRRISVQQGSGASAYSRTTLFAQAMPLVCVACYTGTMEHRRWGAPICAYQNNNTRDSHAHIGAHLIYRLPSCHIWTASSSHTTSKQMRRLPHALSKKAIPI